MILLALNFSTPSGVFLFSSSQYNYNYKLQFFGIRCWWLSSSSLLTFQVDKTLQKSRFPGANPTIFEFTATTPAL
jgi:hypothetical protein